MVYKSLEDLSQSDSLFRSMAFKISGCKTLSDDLVNSFYLKYYNNIQPKEINDGYVYRALQNAYKNHKRDKRFYIQHTTEDIEDSIYDFELDKIEQYKLDLMEFELNDVHWFDKMIFKYINYDNIKIRELSRKTKISRDVITYSYKKTLSKVENLKNKFNEDGL